MTDRFSLTNGNVFRHTAEGVFLATPDVTTRNFALPGESIHNPLQFAFPVGAGAGARTSQAIAKTRTVLGTLDDITDKDRRDAILAVLNEDPEYFNAVSNGLEVSGFGLGQDDLDDDEEFDGTDSDFAFSEGGDEHLQAQANGLRSCLDFDAAPAIGTKATGSRLASHLDAAKQARATHGLDDILRGPNGLRRNKNGKERRRRVARKTRG